MVRRFLAAKQVIPKTLPQPGYGHFLTPLRKVVVDYDPYAQHQDGVRSWITRNFLSEAQKNPEVEFVLRPLRKGRSAVLRGLYVNGRDKVICVNRLDPQQVAQKFDILVNSSGAKIKHLKNNQLEAPPGAESARGIYSILHEHAKPTGGYII
ncbi:hypothetical protein DB88DRAFT_496772 [Papiliotrema laurentii]|uniref:Large ribosomal subunit protein mL43 n=1 Tax=Papiliotrema laurentii TaxID=5418 RepID=A0AAD9CV42_PAPLA|nr:hypothetical protein DB88DRAFT_496772 [Papiliotrema laurentii]